MTPFTSYAPDKEQTTTGIIKSVINIVPSYKGFKSAPGALDAGVGAISAAANSLSVVEKLDGSRRTFAGTLTTIEEVSSGAWVDQSRTVGGAYNVPVDDRWSFAQFGDYTIAANKFDVMQVSTGTTFADISGSPQAKYIAVSEGFIMAVNLSDFSDKWHCSAYNDYSDWVESVSTQSTSGRLIGGGQITGVKKWGDGFIVFKERASYLANYVGSPVVFDFDPIPGDVGCPTSNAAVDIGDRLVFLGHDDFYIFDGARPNPIGDGIREWFFENANTALLYRTIATYNVTTGNVTWYFVSTSAGNSNPDKALVFNVRTGKWGKFSQTIEAAANYYGDGVTYDSLGSIYSTFDSLPTDISYDSTFWSAAVASAGIVKTDHTLYTLTGTSGNTSITMNTFGDDEQFSTIQQIRPRFVTVPQSSTIEYSYDNEYGDSFTYQGTYDLINGKYDLLYSARWHEVKYNFVGNMEIIGTTVNIAMDGIQ